MLIVIMTTAHLRFNLKNTSQGLVLYSNIYSHSDNFYRNIILRKLFFLTNKPSELQVYSNLASFLPTPRKNKIKWDTNVS